MVGNIIGTDAHEEILGTDEDDTIVGLSGYDTLDGGEGSDTYIVNAADFVDRFVDFYNDSGTSGTDTILAAEASIDIGIGSGFGPDSGIEAINGIEGSHIVGDNDQQIWDFSQTNITGVSGIFGNGGMDFITGTNFADTVYGGTGSDTLIGGGGNDTLSGGADSDFIEGGNGRDTIHGDDAHDTIDGGNGRDTLYGDAGHDIIDGGNAQDFIFGGEGNDILNGGNGADRITGGEGYDILDGGENSDIYYVGLENNGFVDTYNDTGTIGTDRIFATEDGTTIGLINGFGTSSGIEVISSRGNANVSIGGTNDTEIWDFSQTRLSGITWINALDGNDVVTGNIQNNRIDAGVGHDIVNGGAGNDQLVGNDGHDILNGDEGRDRLDGGSGADTLDGGADDDTYLFGTDSNGWIDLIKDSGTSTRDRILATEDNVEIGLQSDFSTVTSGIEIISARRHDNVTLEASDEGVNWDFSDVRLNGIAEINGGTGRDIIQGSNRKDVINGGDGHDQLYGGNAQDTLNGGADSDFLYGENGRDTLIGGSGNDILNGGRHRDTLTGGEGFDIFEFSPDSGSDIVTDFDVTADLIDLTAFEGSITYEDLQFVQLNTGLRVIMGSSVALLENVFLETLSEDHFIFPEAEAIVIDDINDPELEIEIDPVVIESVDPVVETTDGPVVEETNTVIEITPPVVIDAPVINGGGNGNDVIEGGSGNDTLAGSHGDDTINGYAGDDNLDGGNGNDTLNAGDGNDTLIGSHGADILSGGAGDDTLDGGNDNDTLDGGTGNDTLIGFNGIDVLIGGDGDDILDGGNDNDTLDGGNGNDSLEGFNGRDVLDGGAGNDTLSGYNDDDILTGGTGDDILTGGFGADSFVFAEGSGTDHITDFESGHDRIDFTSFNGELSFGDLEITVTDGGVSIEYGDSTIILDDFEIGAITEDMFIF